MLVSMQESPLPQVPNGTFFSPTLVLLLIELVCKKALFRLLPVYFSFIQSLACICMSPLVSLYGYCHYSFMTLMALAASQA